ncbi:MAG: ExbD/TolR family protein [Bdellovibrionales bacterium]
MAFYSILNHSFVNQSSLLNLKGGQKKRKKIGETLMLTSLIDAFSILVVYLLMFFSNTGEMTYVNSEINLPKATTIERLDRYSIIQIKKEGYFVEDENIPEDKLVPFLLSLKQKLAKNLHGDNKELETITIQADKSIKYEQLSSVIQACSHVGFSEIKFAVLSE